jgi:hypothetical protein
MLGKLQGQGKMNPSPVRRLPCFVLASAVFFLVLIIRFTQAEESNAPSKPEEALAADQGAQTKAMDSPAKAANGAGGAAPSQSFDPAVVNSGQAAFERSCTTCHDAARSLERTKDLPGWRSTVRRMAAKRDAEIAAAEIEPIAVYLASRNASASGTANGAGAGTTGSPAAGADVSSVSVFATLSPIWRGGNDQLQNPGFGALAFVGGTWQSNIVSARVTLCITCHGVREPGQISRVDPLEAAVRLDLSQFLESCVCGMKGGVDAGRFVVPFGAFSAQVNPGLYRTVSTPLIFNMGQRLYSQDLGFPVLPMPYADNGIDLNLDVPLVDCGASPITATMDAYVVNGLQGNTLGIDFLQSRSLYDNNNEVGGGARLTIGDPYIRAGASVTGGRFDDPNTSGIPNSLNYTIYGFDVQAHYKRLIRGQFEFARRDTDRAGFIPGGTGVFSEAVQGNYVEAEARPWDECRVSLLLRYDLQSRHSPLPPPGSLLTTGTFNVERLTVGINIDLWHSSLLMIDYERWLLPEPDHRNEDVFGARYTITF